MLTRGKSESLIAPQSTILLLLERLLFTQNFMGCLMMCFCLYLISNMFYVSNFSILFFASESPNDAALDRYNFPFSVSPELK